MTACSDVYDLKYRGAPSGRQDDGTAMRHLHSLCNQGHETSCLRVASSWQEPRPGSTPESARAFFEHACASRRRGTCMELGLLLVRTGTDVARGLTLMESDCNDERMPVCNNLGAVYDNGVGVPMDEKRAASYYARGCEAGELTACVNVGYHLLYGTGGVPQDPARAMQIFERGCRKFRPEACHNLGVMYWSGAGTTKDPARAAQLFARGCELGHADACSNEGLAHESGQGVPQNFEKAATLYESACSRNVAPACKRLSILYAHGAEALTRRCHSTRRPPLLLSSSAPS